MIKEIIHFFSPTLRDEKASFTKQHRQESGVFYVSRESRIMPRCRAYQGPLGRTGICWRLVFGRSPTFLADRARALSSRQTGRRRRRQKATTITTWASAGSFSRI